MSGYGDRAEPKRRLPLLKRHGQMFDVAGVLDRAATDRRQDLSVPGARDVMVHQVTANYVQLHRGRTGNRRLGGDRRSWGAFEQRDKSKNKAETDRQKTFHQRLRGAFVIGSVSPTVKKTLAPCCRPGAGRDPLVNRLGP